MSSPKYKDVGVAKEKDFAASLDEGLEPGDTDRTVIQGIKDLTSSLEDRQAYLIVISGSAVGKMFRITDQVVIGRALECDICLDDEGISRRHALVDKDRHGNVAIVDLDSTNGTYFNGSRITRHLLRDGDKIQVGSTTILKFSYQDTLEEAFHQHQYESVTKDGLTGISNKKYFQEQIKKDFSYAVRHNEMISLILFDIDHFKLVNDTFGHQAGDLVLRQLAQLIGDSLRDEDLFARIGGEEFAVVLRQLDEKRAHVLAERIRRTVEVNKFTWEGNRIRVTISLGVATLNQANFPDPASLLRAADSYLYKAKRAGRNRVVSQLRES